MCLFICFRVRYFLLWKLKPFVKTCFIQNNIANFIKVAFINRMLKNLVRNSCLTKTFTRHISLRPTFCTQVWSEQISPCAGRRQRHASSHCFGWHLRMLAIISCMPVDNVGDIWLELLHHASMGSPDDSVSNGDAMLAISRLAGALLNLGVPN